MPTVTALVARDERDAAVDRLRVRRDHPGRHVDARARELRGEHDPREHLVEHPDEPPDVGLTGLGRAGPGEQRPGERIVEQVDVRAVPVRDLGGPEPALSVGDVDHRFSVTLPAPRAGYASGVLRSCSRRKREWRRNASRSRLARRAVRASTYVEGRNRSVDSDLAESVAALKDIFARRGIPATFGKADPAVVEELRKTLRVPARFRAFLQAADPVDVETVTPVERVRLFPSDKLAAEQVGLRRRRRRHARLGGLAQELDRHRAQRPARRPVLPRHLEARRRGRLPRVHRMTGTDSLKPELCASSFQQFLRILATSMEVATGFGDGVHRRRRRGDLPRGARAEDQDHRLRRAARRPLDLIEHPARAEAPRSPTAMAMPDAARSSPRRGRSAASAARSIVAHEACAAASRRPDAARGTVPARRCSARGHGARCARLGRGSGAAARAAPRRRVRRRRPARRGRAPRGHLPAGHASSTRSTRSSACSARAAWASSTSRATCTPALDVVLRPSAPSSRTAPTCASARSPRAARSRRSITRTSSTSTPSSSTGTSLWLVMQYIDGESLEHDASRGYAERAPARCRSPRRSRSSARSPPASAPRTREGVIHRDLKPANILIRSKDGVAKVTDFGIAKVEADARAGRGQTKGIIGSLWYMSPEQVTGRRDLDKRVDIYALGIVLYEMLVGRVPFDAESDYEIMRLHAEAPMPLRRRRAPRRPAGARRPHPEGVRQGPREALRELRGVRSRRSTRSPALRRPRFCAARRVEPPAAPRGHDGRRGPRGAAVAVGRGAGERACGVAARARLVARDRRRGPRDVRRGRRAARAGRARQAARLAHLAATAFFAMATRCSGDNAAARARPPFDAPSRDSVTAATLRRSFLDITSRTECLPEHADRTEMASV